MNILRDRLPVSLEVAGRVYPINSDYRVGLTIMQAMEDTELCDAEKQLVTLRLLYPTIPDDVPAAYEMALRFLNCGEAPNEVGEAEEPERLYSFAKDAKYIYTAILQTHGIDLERTEYLHWWKFQYLFLDIREDCFFSRILYYRSQRAKGKLTKEELAYCETIRDILDLPTEEDEELKRKADLFMAALGGGKHGV